METSQLITNRPASPKPPVAGLLNRDPHLGSAYPVSLPAFEGPLDLLLHLIEREELDVSTISLVAVTDQYLQTLSLLEEIEPGALADFLVVASRLLYIKSSRLLPKPATDSEDDEDSGDGLIQRLLEYRQFKRAAESLRNRETQGWRVYVRTAPLPEIVAADQRPPDLGDLDLSGLHGALRRALQRVPVAPPAPTVRPYTVTVAERIESVRVRLRQAWTPGQNEEPVSPITFAELLAEAESRIEIIVTFLAILELVKQEEVTTVQEKTFGEIMLLPGATVPDMATAGEPDAMDASERDGSETRN